ncbi:hypothetical protein Cs7R123_14880 [Catellatospora sp. TT07R-123]|uniref:DUF4265 domain-containing protein n=1 Tax=Catellatospora sp. TT07R-123 TaxID=2733863 RepID=UPI001B14E543|nr:DUF4265 domain-containing protein [Catellatospora sp. TT07R-123]GHJ44146.1 hypothetical protein Cs7R123_14880 [Catellatospora sp. TT07R-123]
MFDLDADPGQIALAFREADGQMFREVVAARRLPGGLIELLASPGLVMGCAEGDVLVLEGSGFHVVRRGPNLCVQAYADPQFTDEVIARFAAAFDGIGGRVDAPEHRQFLVVTVAADAGEEAVEALMEELAAGVPGLEWQFGNGSR